MAFTQYIEVKVLPSFSFAYLIASWVIYMFNFQLFGNFLNVILYLYLTEVDYGQQTLFCSNDLTHLKYVRTCFIGHNIAQNSSWQGFAWYIVIGCTIQEKSMKLAWLIL